jgi:hypothetical protein
MCGNNGFRQWIKIQRLCFQFDGPRFPTGLVISIAAPAHLDDEGVKARRAGALNHSLNFLGRRERVAHHPKSAHFGRY